MQADRIRCVPPASAEWTCSKHRGAHRVAGQTVMDCAARPHLGASSCEHLHTRTKHALHVRHKFQYVDIHNVEHVVTQMAVLMFKSCVAWSSCFVFVHSSRTESFMYVCAAQNYVHLNWSLRKVY
jgi:hypothetical protein